MLFACNSLKEVIVPCSATSVGSGAFSECENIRSVYNYGKCRPVDKLSFDAPTERGFLSGELEEHLDKGSVTAVEICFISSFDM